MSNFIINNIDLLVALVVVLVGLVKAVVSKNKQQIYANIYGLVSDAEQLGSKAGINKFNYVFDNAYNKLPIWLKWFISEDDIKRAIEFSLNKLKAFTKEQGKVEDKPVEVQPQQITNEVQPQ